MARLSLPMLWMISVHSMLHATTPPYDVVIYGGTSAAVVTAVQVKRMGKTAIILSPDQHLGGLTSGGLGWTDSGNKNAIGGLSREFYHRVWKHYQRPDAWRWEDQAKFGNRNQSPSNQAGDGATMWVFEPHVAEKIFEEMIAEYQIPVVREQRLDRRPGRGVAMRSGRITNITMMNGEQYAGRMFVDATYEGDLMAAAGVGFHVGREANSVYDEQWNGIQVGVLHHAHWFKKAVDPYIEPGDPSSGLLPGISDQPPGIKGNGDHRVQAYCFRMCLTNVDQNRIPFAKPQGYDAAAYELLARVFDSGWREAFNKFDPIPNHKTDTNNHGPFSTDYIGMSDDYPNASYQRRQEMIDEHIKYQQGLMYFIANDPRVPDEIRTAMSKWGLAKDEFTDNGGWPHQIYVREARRMIGEYVMTEHDCLDRIATPKSVGMGSYTLDSHNVQRYVTPKGYVQNEGDIGVKTPRPYEIAYGSLTPKKSECANLLVPVCVSSSHIAFGSIRMEPVFMILGQSAATAACLSIDHDVAVQDLPYADLQRQLIADKQVLELDSYFQNDSAKMAGIVLDDQMAKRKGFWKSSTANPGFVNAGYLHNDDVPSVSTNVTFETLLEDGLYEVRVSYPVNRNRATNVPVTVFDAEGKKSVRVNQRIPPPIDGLFVSLGQFRFDDRARVEIGTEQTDGYVIVDSVQFLPVAR